MNRVFKVSEVTETLFRPGVCLEEALPPFSKPDGDITFLNVEMNGERATWCRIRRVGVEERYFKLSPELELEPMPLFLDTSVPTVASFLVWLAWGRTQVTDPS